jgi:hypothetical protein
VRARAFSEEKRDDMHGLDWMAATVNRQFSRINVSSSNGPTERILVPDKIRWKICLPFFICISRPCITHA